MTTRTPEPRWFSSARAPGRSIAERVINLGCGVAIVFLLVQILTFGYGRDQGIYAMVARGILAGRMPYRDAWDFKPPGVFLLYAASRALFGSSQVGIRVVEVAGLVAMIAAMMRLTGEWWGDRRIGLMAGAIAVLVHAQLDFWHTAQPESFGGMVTIFALAVLGPMMGSGAPVTMGAPAPKPPTMGAPAPKPPTMGAPAPKPPVRADERDRTRRLLISGALFGFAGLLKPPLAGGGAVVAAALGLRILGERGVWRAALRPAALMVAGGAAPFVLCLSWFAIRGGLGDLYRVLFVFTPHYTRLSWVGRPVLWMTYEAFTDWCFEYCSVASVGVILCLAFPREPRERFGVRVIGAIVAVQMAGVIMQAKFFPYHWGATWPVTALLAGLGFHRVWERLARAGVAGAAAFWAGVAVVFFGRTATKDLDRSFVERCGDRLATFRHFPPDQVAVDRLASVADVNAVANREVAAFLRARVPADRPVFIWGFEPVIYDLADRAPATRYLYDVPQRVAWARDREREILMRDLETSRPAAIVVEHRDVFPMVTGDVVDSADTLRGFPALAELIAYRYVLGTTIEDFDVYLEKR